MLGNSAVVVVPTRPRAIPLTLITIRKSTHGFLFLSHDEYGAPLGGGDTELLRAVVWRKV